MRIAALVATLGLAACTTGDTTADRSEPTTHTVTIEGMLFVPAALTVVPGDTIVWINKDLVPHTATSAAGRFDSKDIPAGKSWTLTIRNTGNFDYVCTFHPTMKAVVRVQS